MERCSVNDIRNLMDHLQADLEYKEFEVAAPAQVGSWAVLDRISRAAASLAANAEPPLAAISGASSMSRSPAVSASAPRVAPPAAAPVAVIPAAAAVVAQARAPASRGSLLGRYATADAAEVADAGEGLGLPLADVFARLARAGSPRCRS